MPSKKSRTARGRGGRGRRKSRAAPRRIWRYLAAAILLLVLVAAGYGLHLAKTVRVKFEGQRWAEPAQIFARPLDLYVGAGLSPEQLEAELRFVGYRPVSRVSAPAQWSRNGSRFTLHTRPFRLWDGDEPARRFDIELRDGRVARMRAADGSELDLVRFEPALVGSIYPAHSEDRVLIRRADLPEHLVDALLAAEDRRFYEHPGVDVRGLARAVLANVRAGRAVQGGSTLTQQLVKNFILTPERSLWRKFNEAMLALVVEARYDKDEILEAYANEIFLGQDGARAIHGFGLAAQHYFGRPVGELGVHESALLVALVRGASYYNPYRHPQRALERRNRVLAQMAEQGSISAEAAQSAAARPLGLVASGAGSVHRVPAFVDLVRRQLRRDYREEDLTSEGLRIFTTLDPWVQQRAADALARRLDRLERDRGMEPGTLQGAVVVAAAQNGEVQAVVGGREAGYAGFNRALDAVRPIGSLVKPAVYLAALAQPGRFTLVTPLADRPVDLVLDNGQRWQPENYDRQVHGEVALHDALARSLNLATVNLGLQIGLEPVIDLLQRLGVEREIPPYPSVLLGALSLSPVEVAQVYQALAAGGFRSPLRAILAVVDSQQQPLQRYPLTVSAAADPATVFLLTRNLVEVTASGTGAALGRLLPDGREVAGKTGTTNDLRDSWFAGYSADRVAVAWIGRDDNAPTGLTGASGALPLWADVMRAIPVEPLQRTVPAGVEYHWVDATGRLTAEHCQGAVAFPFLAGSRPQAVAPCLEDGPAPETGVGGFLQRLFRQREAE